MKVNNKRRIVIISELFFPDETSTAFIMTKIACHLSKEFDVLVLAGPNFYKINQINPSDTHCERKNIIIKRVWAPNLSKDKLFTRILRLLIVSFGLTRLVQKNVKKEDIVLCVTNPSPMIVALAALHKLKKFSFIFLVHDVFPENLVALGLISNKSFFYKFVKPIFDWSYGASNLLVAIGRDMADILRTKVKEKKIDIEIIENWCELDLITPIEKKKSKAELWGLSKKIIIQYAGNIGRAQGILEFLKILKESNNKNIQYLFVGTGALVPALAKEINLFPNVSLRGKYSRSDQDLILGTCDIALVLLREGMYGLGVPSKIYNIMASGRPILFVGPINSEVCKLISEFKIGWSFCWDDKENLIKFLNSLTFSDIDKLIEMGARARLCAEQHYSESIQLQKFSKVVKNLMINEQN